jgi:hypothetical protein
VYFDGSIGLFKPLLPVLRGVDCGPVGGVNPDIDKLMINALQVSSYTGYGSVG